MPVVSLKKYVAVYGSLQTEYYRLPNYQTSTLVCQALSLRIHPHRGTLYEM